MRFGATETNCRSCQEIYPADDLDRYLWCARCRKAVMARGVRWGRLVGIVASLGVTLYLVLRVHPSGRYLAFYALLVGMTYMLTSRIGVVVSHGYYRARGAAPGSTSEES